MQIKRPYIKKCAKFTPRIYEPLHLAYLAGIIDGEGCLWIGKIGREWKRGYISTQYRGILKISVTDKELIDWLLKTFQGTESAAQKYQPKAQLSRMVYTWTVTGDRLLDLCEQVLPYLIIKKNHCEIMIKFRKTYTQKLGNNQIPKEILEIRQKCLDDIRKLTTRSRNHSSKKHHNPSALLPVS